MNAAVVDTDVVSILFKRDSRAELYDTHVAGRLLAISFMTLAELERWTLERNWGVIRSLELREFVKKFVVLPPIESFAESGRKCLNRVAGAAGRFKPPTRGSPPRLFSIRCR